MLELVKPLFQRRRVRHEQSEHGALRAEYLEDRVDGRRPPAFATLRRPAPGVLFGTRNGGQRDESSRDRLHACDVIRGMRFTDEIARIRLGPRLAPDVSQFLVGGTGVEDSATDETGNGTGDHYPVGEFTQKSNGVYSRRGGRRAIRGDGGGSHHSGGITLRVQLSDGLIEELNVGLSCIRQHGVIYRLRGGSSRKAAASYFAGWPASTTLAAFPHALASIWACGLYCARRRRAAASQTAHARRPLDD